MKYKLLYVFENALKSLVRTAGIKFTALSIFFISLLAFFSLDITFFLFHWETQAKSDALSNGLLGFQSLSPALLVLSMFKFMSLLATITLFLLAISHIKRIFSQYIALQKVEILTMSFIGQTASLISLELALQALYTVIIVGSFSCFFAGKVLACLLNDTSKAGIFVDIISSFKLPTYLLGIIILLLGLYIFFRIFYSAQKELYSLVNQDILIS